MDQAEKVSALLAWVGAAFSTSGALIPDETYLRGTTFAPLCYYLSCENGCKPGRDFLEAYLCASTEAMRQKMALEQLFAQLEKEEIPFVPVKGADLAFRVYPYPALRSFGDWDIWVHPRDLKRFCAFLQRDNWRCALDSFSDHHAGVRSKDGFCVEPHFSLPNFPVPGETLWSETRAVPGKKYERRLTAELNLTMIFRHTLVGARSWRQLLKGLVDVEFLLRAEPVDWQKITALARRWRIAHPALFLAAFPEFFRGRHPTGIVFADGEIAALRSWLLTNADENDPRCCERNARSGSLLSLFWLKAQLLRLRRDNLRYRYPQMGDGTARYLLFLARDLAGKAAALAKGYCFPDRNVTGEMKIRKRIEHSWKTASRSRCR